MSEVKPVQAEPGVDPLAPIPAVQFITLPELAAVVAIVTAVIVGVVMKPDKAELFIGFGAPTVLALLAATKAQRNGEQTRRNGEQTRQVHLQINSRMTELLEKSVELAKYVGRDEQREVNEVKLAEQKAELKIEIQADRQQVKAEIKSDKDDAAPVEVVNLPHVQKVEVVVVPVEVPADKKEGKP